MSTLMIFKFEQKNENIMVNQNQVLSTWFNGTKIENIMFNQNQGAQQTKQNTVNQNQVPRTWF